MAKMIEIPTADILAEIDARWDKRNNWVRDSDPSGAGFHVPAPVEANAASLYISSPDAAERVAPVPAADVADAVEEARSDIGTLMQAASLLPDLVGVAREILSRFDEVVLD